MKGSDKKANQKPGVVQIGSGSYDLMTSFLHEQSIQK